MKYLIAVAFHVANLAQYRHPYTEELLGKS